MRNVRVFPGRRCLVWMGQCVLLRAWRSLVRSHENVDSGCMATSWGDAAVPIRMKDGYVLVSSWSCPVSRGIREQRL